MNVIFRIVRRVVNATFYFQFGLQKGKNVDIRRRVFFDKPENVTIGDNSLVNYGCGFHIGCSDNAFIRIGKNVQIGMNCVFTCVSHDYGGGIKEPGNTHIKVLL